MYTYREPNVGTRGHLRLPDEHGPHNEPPYNELPDELPYNEPCIRGHLYR